MESDLRAAEFTDIHESGPIQGQSYVVYSISFDRMPYLVFLAWQRHLISYATCGHVYVDPKGIVIASTKE